jgi:hypothetical protein
MKMAKTTIHWMLLLSFLVVIGISTGSAQETPGGPDDNNEGNNDVIESGDIDPDTGLPEDSEELPEDEGELPEGGDADETDPGNVNEGGTDVYAVELDNGKELLFNSEGAHLHTALVDSENGPVLDVVDIPQGIMDWVETNALGGIYNVYRELSVEEGSESFIYWVDFEDSLTAIFDSEGQLINAHYEDDDHQEGEGEHHGEDSDDGDTEDATDPTYAGEPGEGLDGEDQGDGETRSADGDDSGTDVYAVELDNGKELFFNVVGEHLHTALIDSQDGPALDAVDIPQGIMDWVASNALGEIYNV